MVQAAARRRAEFPSRADALNSYRGRGAFKTWPETMLADYVAAAFRDLPGGHVTLACDPAWEASTYAGQGHDLAAALARSRCPIDIFKADLNSTCHLDALAPAAEPPSRVHIETVAGASHFLPMERPDVVQAALREAIEKRPVGPG
jgi:pimeloyl-ACP methyl ester carboxylesterase